MKPLNSFRALLIAACLIAGATGCNKTAKNPTFIPKPTTVPVAEDTTATTPIAPKTGPVTTPPVSTPRTIVSTPPPTGSGTLGGSDVPAATKLPLIEDPGARTGGSTLPPGTIDPQTLTQAQKDNQIVRPEGTEDKEVLKAETVHFEYDKSTVKASERPKVERVAAYLRNDPKVSLRVEGNCDERGTEEYNRSLGERRALAVREYLVNLGIAPERITTLSFGEDKPLNQGHDEAAWSENRRGDFVVIRPTNLQ